MPGSNNRTSSEGEQNKPANLSTSTPSPESRSDRCSAPSPSPGISAFVAAREARPQSLQTAPSPSRPGPLFTSRPPARQKHTTFKIVKIHTAKCDVCNHHNTATLNRCVDCGWQICTPCLTDRGGDSTHTGGPGKSTTPNNPRPNIPAANPTTPANPTTTRATPPSNTPASNSTTPTNPATTRTNPPFNVPTPNTTTPVNDATTNPTLVQRGRASRVGASSLQTPEPPGATLPLHIRDFAYPPTVHTYTPTGTVINSNPYGPTGWFLYCQTHAPFSPVNANSRTSAMTSDQNGFMGTLPDPFTAASSSATLQEGSINQSAESGPSADRKSKKQKQAEKGKGKELSVGNETERDEIFGPSLAEGSGSGKKLALRPRKVMNYYPELIPIEDTDIRKKVDDGDSESEGGDIPFESPNTKPSVGGGVDSPSHASKGKSAIQARNQKASRASKTLPGLRTNADTEVESGSDNLLRAAAEALVELKTGKKTGENGEGSSKAGSSSMTSHKPTALMPNKKQSQEQPVPGPSTLPAKRKRRAPIAQLRPARTQSRVSSKLQVHTDPREASSTSKDVEMKDAPPLVSEPETNEASTSAAEPEIKLEAGEDQDAALARVPEEPSTGSTSGAPTGSKKVSPRLQELYRSALRVKDRNGKLKRLHNHGPKN